MCCAQAHYQRSSFRTRRVRDADVGETRCRPQPRLRGKIADGVRHLRMERKRSQSCKRLLFRQQNRAPLEEMLARRRTLMSDSRSQQACRLTAATCPCYEQDLNNTVIPLLWPGSLVLKLSHQCREHPFWKLKK
ncbi:uncharacterized protein LOC142771791 isoform X2 [Rhipicephalus microplus]|uniref:uncharacterized protein LOC142771791 isoform X2 n=1 Tax=Rhipicephalus microplus TaxID=6941 RepID=UPI003F6CD427